MDPKQTHMQVPNNRAVLMSENWTNSCLIWKQEELKTVNYETKVMVQMEIFVETSQQTGTL